MTSQMWLSPGAALGVWSGASSMLATIATARSHTGSLPRDVALWALRCVHFASTLGIITYPFLFGAEFDAVYLGMATCVIASWYLCTNECMLSVAEKRMLDPGYVTGSEPYRHVYLEMVVGPERNRQLPIFVAMVVVYTFVALRYSTRLPPVARLVAWALVLAGACMNLANMMTATA